MGEWVVHASDLPVLGQILYRLNVNPAMVRMMARGHVYSDPNWLTGERFTQKMAVVAAPGAGVEDALLACPREILHAEADDVDGELLSRRMELFAEVAGRASAGLFAVGEHDDDARLPLPLALESIA